MIYNIKNENFFANFWKMIKFLWVEIYKIVINDTKVQITIIVITIIIIFLISLSIANAIYKNKSSNDPKKLYSKNEQ